MALTIESDSVRAYLPMLQAAVSRMASNSASCKTWCVTLVSALILLAIDKNKPQAILVGLLPVGLFFLLDAYYLSLERDFRSIYNSFVAQLKAADNTAEQAVYSFTPPEKGFGHRAGGLISAIFSPSVLPFYGVLVAALLITRFKFLV